MELLESHRAAGDCSKAVGIFSFLRKVHHTGLYSLYFAVIWPRLCELQLLPETAMQQQIL